MQLEAAIEATKAARQEKQTDQEIEGLNDINSWCGHLYAYVHWKEGVVKTLLTKTAFNLRVVLEKGGT